MAEIKPFRGIRYGWENLEAEEMGKLVAPPYDVIDEDEQEQLYRTHPANIVRLDLNRIKRTDNGDDNRYERARRHLFDWIARGILVVDRRPTIYVHEQEFVDETGTKFVRRGFIGLAKLADYDEKIVLPHERTLRGPKEDRLELMKATECNLSQIFFLYDDPDSEVDKVLFSGVESGEEPEVDIATDDGLEHRLWSVTDPKIHRAAQKALVDSPLLIADGHHRYETALAYRNFRRRIDEDPAVDAPYEYVMGFFVNLHDPGLQVFPTHRIVHSVEDFDFEGLCKKLEASPYFSVTPMEPEALAHHGIRRETLADAAREGPTFAAVASGGERGAWIQFTGDESAPFFGEEVPETVRRLDVTILHDGIFEEHLDIDRDAQSDMSRLAYAKSWEGAEEALGDASTQMVVFMNPTRIKQVNDVCLSGGKMPQKSTYFYPKILSGLAINPL